MKNVQIKFTSYPFGNRYEFTENLKADDDLTYDFLYRKYILLIFQPLKNYSQLVHQKKHSQKVLDDENTNFEFMLNKINNDLLFFLVGDSTLSYTQEFEFKLFNFNVFVFIKYNYTDESNDIKDII